MRHAARMSDKCAARESSVGAQAFELAPLARHRDAGTNSKGAQIP